MNFIHIGKTLKAHGIKGELKFALEELYLPIADALNIVFLDINDAKIPYFVEQVALGKNSRLKLEDIIDRTQAEKLEFKKIYLREEDLEPVKPFLPEVETLQYEYLIGYQLQDSELGMLGEILAVEEFPQQEMAILQHNGKEVMIPLHESLIVKEDKEAKIIELDLPEGLLDL